MRVDFDGDIVDVDDNATPEQLESYYQQHVRSKQQSRTQAGAKQAYEGTNPAVKFAVGVGSAAAEPVLGLSQLLAQGAEKVGIPGAGAARADLEDRIGTVRGAREGAGGWGTAGEVASWLAPGNTIAGLGTAALRRLGVKAAEKAIPKIAAGAGAEALAQGAYEGSRGTLEGDPSRGKRAATGAAYGAAGAAGGDVAARTLGRVVAPVRTIAPEAAELQRRAAATGVPLNLTVGQRAGKGSWLGSAEEGLAGFPVLGGPIRRGREGAVADWNLVQLREAAARLGKAAPLKITEPGVTGIQQLQNLVDDAYRGATKGVTIKVPMMADPFQRTRRALSGLPADQQQSLGPMIDNLLDRVRSGKLSGDQIVEERSKLAKLAREKYLNGEGSSADILDQLDDDFADVARYYMSPAQAKQWAAANAAYTRLKPINRAAGMAGSIDRGGLFSPSQLRSGTTRGMGEGAKAAQRSPLLRETTRAQEALGNTLPAPGPGTAEKLLTAGAIGSAGFAADRALSGDFDWQAGVGPGAAALFLATRPGNRYLSQPKNRKALIDALRKYEGATQAAGARLAINEQDQPK